MADLVTFGETMLRLSVAEGDRIETATSLDFRTAGAESNVAVTAARLGTDTVWLSKLPDSALGRRVTHELSSHDVETVVRWDDEHRQGTYYIEQGSQPRPTNVIYDRADSAITTATTDELQTETVADAEVFYTSGITPALSETLEGTTADLLAHADENDVTTAFDLNYRSKLWEPETARGVCQDLFEHVDVLVTAERDARDVLQREGTPAEIGRGLATDFDFETVVVTLGSKGALAVHDGTTVEQSAFETETIDPIGTGDAFVGAFLSRRIDGDTVESALQYAAATAALKRTISGDLAVVTPEEVDQVLGSEREEISR